MLEAAIVIILIAAAIGVAARAGFSWWTLVISIGVLEVLGLVLLGLPGAAFLAAIAPVMQRLGWSAITGDAAWPAAIMMSTAWPIALAPAYVVARSIRGGIGQRSLVALVVLVVECFTLGMLVYGISAA